MSDYQDLINTIKTVEGVSDLMEMAMNLRQGDTGLPMVIWVSTREAYGSKINHGPRIKVMVTHDQKAKRNLMYSLDVTPPYLARKPAGMVIDSADLKIVREWIKKHKSTIIDYWNDEISASEFIKRIGEK